MTQDEEQARGEWKRYVTRVAEYLHANYSRHGLVVYTEVAFGKTIIGKNRKVDIFLVRRRDQRALAIECKFQASGGTTDEKIPYALEDLEALWVPGCLAYGGHGWSDGVQQMLRAARHAAFCDPVEPAYARTADTRELDHVVAAVFGMWDEVLSDNRRLRPDGQLLLPAKGPKKARSPGTQTKASGES